MLHFNPFLMTINCYKKVIVTFLKEINLDPLKWSSWPFPRDQRCIGWCIPNTFAKCNRLNTCTLLKSIAHFFEVCTNFVVISNGDV